MSTKHAIAQLRDALRLSQADGRDLTRIGRNNAVNRPKFNNTNDELYRKLIPKLSWSPKMVRKVFWDILTIFLGDYSLGLWNIFQIRPNQIIIEIDGDTLSSAELTSATYMQRSTNATVATETAVSDAAIGDTTLNVADTTGSPATGYIHIGTGLTQEVIGYSAFGPTSYTLVHGLKKNHALGVNVNVYVVETSATSYIGDYFVATPRTSTLASPVLIGESSATLSTTNPAIPADGIVWFEELEPTRREKHYALISGTSVELQNTTFAFDHAAGTEFKWFDLQASVNEASSTANGGNAIILYADTIVEDLKFMLDFVKASGVELIVERV